MTLAVADIPIHPPVLLAPMAGITDVPFRRMVARFGAGLVVSEMVASAEVITERRSHRARARTDLGLAGGRRVPTSVQLAGREPGPMAEAARIVTDLGADIIDINMGCPAKQVTGGASGSALMRDPDHALRLIEAVVGATDRPVTLKCRLGWDETCLNAAAIARRAEAAGVRMLVIHGRTRAQFYKGSADWDAIAAVRRAVTIPVIANGDIVDAGTARTALARSGAAGVMVGRGAQGAPWRLAEISAALHGTPRPVVPEGEALAALVREHHEGILSFYGVDLGLRIARKHLGWYADEASARAAPGQPGAGVDPALRARMMTATTVAEVHGLIAAAFAGVAGAPAVPDGERAVA